MFVLKAIIPPIIFMVPALFAAEPYISDVQAVFPAGQTAVDSGDFVVITAQVSPLVVTSIACSASTIGGSSNAAMYDDGEHKDGEASDGIYGTDSIQVNVTGTAYYGVTVSATVGGNTITVPGRVAVDNQPPVVSSAAAVYPAGQAAASKNNEIFVTARLSDTGTGVPKNMNYGYVDASPLGGPSQVLMYDDGEHGDGAAFDSVFGSGPVAITSAETGVESLTVYGVDGALNVQSMKAAVSLDNLPPVMGNLFVTYPSGRTVVHNGDKVVFHVAVSDTGTVSGIGEVLLDATQLGAGTSLTMKDDGTAPDTSASDGIYTSDSVTVNNTGFSGTAAVYAHGVDQAGNQSTAGGGVLVDNQAPEISKLELNYPGGQSAAKQGDALVINVLVIDRLSGVESVKIVASGLDTAGSTYLLMDNKTRGDVTAGDNVFTHTFTVTEDTTATGSFSIIATDREGNADTLAGSALLDNTPPVIASVQVKDADSVYRNGETVTLLCSADAAGYNVAGNFSAMDNKFLSGAENIQDHGDGAYTVQYTLSEKDTMPEGLHTVMIYATDEAGLKDTGRAVLLMDNSTPAVALTVPEADTLLSGEISIQFTATDDDSVYTTEISVDGQAWDTTTARTASGLNTTLLRDGAHIVQVRATDGHGNTGYSPLTSFKTFNSPSVTIRAPEPDSVLAGTVTVRFTSVPVAPATIEKREVSIDGNAWTDSLVDTTSYPMATLGWEDGTHSIQVRVTDGQKRTGYSKHRPFIVDNSPPKISLPSVRYAGENITARKGTKIAVSSFALDVIVGLDPDSGVVFMTDNLDTVSLIAILRDDGVDTVSGDSIKGDNIFTAIIPVNNDTTGTIEYAIRVRDKLGNDTALISTIVLDNDKPEVAYILEPQPKEPSDSIRGEVYVSRVMMKGWVSDSGSGLSVVRLTVKNDSGDNINNSPVQLKPEKNRFSRIINLVPGKNFISLLAVDKAGNSSSLQTPVEYILPKVTQMVTPDKQFTVRSPNGSKVFIPKKALHHAGEITLRVVDQDEEPKPLEQDVKLLGIPHDFGPSGTVFRKPVKITIAYSDLDLDPDQDLKPDYNPLDLAIYFWDGARWLLAGVSNVDTAARTVSVAVNHFTLYDIGLDTTGASPVSEKFSAYWTHNPVKQEEGSTFVVNVPKEGRLSLRIFDMAGDLVNAIFPEKQVEAGPLSLMWGGDNVMGYFAGAGLYIYMLKYESDDGSIKKLKRKPIGLLKN